MLQILRAELRYGIWGLAIVLFVPVVYGYELADGESTEFLIVLFAFLAVNTYFTVRNRENRDSLLAMLPVPAWQIAAARVLLVVIPTSVMIVPYVLLNLFQAPRSGFDGRFVVVGSALLLAVYSVFFISRDLLADKLARHGKTMIGIAALVMGLLTAGGVAVMIELNSGSAPSTIHELVTGIRAYNPFRGELGPAKFLGFSVLLAALSVLSYRRRRSFVPGPPA